MKTNYTPEVESIRQDLIKEVKKTLPSTNNSSEIEIKTLSESGFYIGTSIESLSLSDLALMIDDPRV